MSTKMRVLLSDEMAEKLEYAATASKGGMPIHSTLFRQLRQRVLAEVPDGYRTTGNFELDLDNKEVRVEVKPIPATGELHCTDCGGLIYCQTCGKLQMGGG